RTHDLPGNGELVIEHAVVESSAEDQLLLDAIRDLARRWGATLEIEQRDQQRLMRLTVPAAEHPTPPPERPAPAHTRPVRGLIVDGDAGNRETVGELLSLSGYEVDDAASAEEALRAVERGPYSAALVDLAMPGMNGIELARRLRVLHPDLRIALVTGWELSQA